MEPVTIQDRTLTFGKRALTFVKSIKGTPETNILVQQFVRSATSIGANVAKGQGGASRQDFLRFLVIARKSAFETAYWLSLLLHHLPSNHTVQELQDECRSLTKTLTAIILKIRSAPGGTHNK